MEKRGKRRKPGNVLCLLSGHRELTPTLPSPPRWTETLSLNKSFFFSQVFDHSNE
jgi:hypothetical protein